jgi:hypothetical protein
VQIKRAESPSQKRWQRAVAEYIALNSEPTAVCLNRSIPSMSIRDRSDCQRSAICLKDMTYHETD